MQSVPPKAVISSRYMTRFQCLGGDCEATCCGGGVIPVSDKTHRRLTVLAEGDVEASALLARGIEPTPNGPDHARIRFLPSGDCSMRDEHGLCRVHTRFGHAELFEVCATYPRYASEIDDEIELFGTLACPEVARLALLADDAFELAHLTLDAAPRLLRNRFTTDQPYFKPFKQVRGAFVQLLATRGQTLPEKLFAMLWLADKLKGVLYAGCAPVPALRLETTLSALSQPEVLAQLSSSFRALDLDGALPISIIVAVLRPPPEPRRGAQTEGFDAMWRGVQERYGSAVAPGGVASDAEVREIGRHYRELCARVSPAARLRIEQCLTRYGVNHLLTTPHMLSANLFDYAYDLVVRLASLCFLLNTRLAEFQGGDAELDRQIVEATYSFVRTVEHADMPHELEKLLHEQGLDGLAHAVCFLALLPFTAASIRPAP
jgi:lysine-N-methylase